MKYELKCEYGYDLVNEMFYFIAWISSVTVVHWYIFFSAVSNSWDTSRVWYVYKKMLIKLD